MAMANKRYLRVYIHVRKDECRAMQEFLAKQNTELSRSLYSTIRANITMFEMALSKHGLRKISHGADLETYRVNLLFLEEYSEEYKVIEMNIKNHIMRDALRQLALYGTLSPEQALAKELCRNATYKAGRKRKGKSICETETAKIAPVNTALLACLKGKKDPRALFGQEHHGDLHYAMSLEVSRFVAGTRTNLADAEYDWSLVPPSEYPKVIRDSSSLVDLKTLLRQVNPALVDK